MGLNFKILISHKLYNKTYATILQTVFSHHSHPVLLHLLLNTVMATADFCKILYVIFHRLEPGSQSIKLLLL